jgi:inhibitor of KinA sporulation pathway (predicted exonuclease)
MTSQEVIAIDTFIVKGINGASIGNAFECHVRPVRETRSTGKCIFTEKAPI